MSAGRRLALWGPVVAYLAVIFAVSEQSRIPGAEYAWDKLLHATGYGVLGLLSLRAFHGGLGRLRPAPTLAAFLLTVGYGATDEIHQSFVPGRESSFLDVVADATGFLGAALVLYLGHRFGDRPDAVPRGGEKA